MALQKSNAIILCKIEYGRQISENSAILYINNQLGWLIAHTIIFYDFINNKVIVLNIKIPNLPKRKVKCVIVDCNAPKSLFDFFDINRIKYIKSQYIRNTLNAVSTHPDMQICHLGGNNFVCGYPVYEYYLDKLNVYGVNVTKGENVISSTYPNDISYNVVITENFLIHNLKYTEKMILKSAECTGISIYNVKQGYTKCATCVIDNNALITSDKGIYKVCTSNNIDCLLIDKDCIKLGDRYDGFLGGCCGMIDYKTLLFCGDISAHKSYNEIVNFASKYGVEIVSSSKEILTDVGSIIPVVQE